MERISASLARYPNLTASEKFSMSTDNKNPAEDNMAIDSTTAAAQQLWLPQMPPPWLVFPRS